MNSASFKKTILKWRVYFVLVSFLLIVLVIVSQLYRIQIVRGEMYSAKAQSQHVRPISDLLNRGSIFFTDKNGQRINAATLKTGYTIAINPKNIKNPEDVYNNIGLFLDIDEDFYISRADKINDPYEEIARRVAYDTGKKIARLNIEGLFIEKENWRFYPAKDLAAQTIGFIAYKDDKLTGRYGLERYYNDILEKRSDETFSNFFAEFFSNDVDDEKDEEGAKESESKSQSGGSIITTLDPEVQSFVQSELNRLYQKWNSKKIGAIIMSPQNGEIISMALLPTFDINEFNLAEDPSIYSNDLVESVYEMGSIMKPITIAIGLDTGSITSGSTYDDKGFISLDGYTIYNYDKKNRGIVDMQEVLNKSLNTGASFVASKVGKQNFANYLKIIFGFKTKIDLPNEVDAMISNLDNKTDVEYATASFGQGIAMSPISITRALASLGNGGKLVWPHLVKEIEYDSGKIEKKEMPESIQIFKKETSEEISRMLVRVVDEALKNGEVALKNYNIAAKTGTAQIPSPEGGYYPDKFLHSFFGYFPAYDPHFIVFLYQIEPQGAQYASETLTEPFINITKFLINYYDIEPDRQEKENENNL